ncbi:HEAT repeat domain-containing protein [Myxococcus stipitatus]|uniref:HEAT repeat domain-containing protein n=1 Tax=Myxococcus stipitatus TaxID=83455 RepID=UPI001F1D4880|nr:HEAT repeat domain-containing protein [Myxococcus stipitatus]MCE9671801.1 HEAT repeat domain-containing protein [Myxococcus stipitatus]
MTEVRRLKPGMGAMTEIISDKDELTKGAQLFDGKQLANLSRYENKLFADASGSGATPYKVSLVFNEPREVKGRCSCMAARSRPFCKHAAALLVAWSRTPDAFVTADAPPAGAAGPARKSVKKGKTEAVDLMRSGVEQVSTLVRELGLSGVASLAADRPQQVRALGEALRANGLRRLAARAVEVAGLLEQAVARTGAFEPPVFTDLVADMLLTARKVEKHLGGEALEDRYVEELIGKTWTKKDRAPAGPLTLLEYAFTSRVTPDDYLVRESRFLELGSGRHYAEKQIIPAFLKRVEPKRSHAGMVLVEARGGQYPGFAPHRLDLEDTPRSEPVDGDALGRLVDAALPDVGAVLTAFQEHRKDVFAPELLPVAVRVRTLVASGQRSQWVDDEGRGVFLPADPRLEEPLAAALEGARLRAVLGDLGLEAALPTLFPLALVVETEDGLELRGLGPPGTEEEARGRRRARPAVATAVAVPRSGWSEAARAAGASEAAIALAEVRDELAERFSHGLASVSSRAVEPLVARLRELGLEKPAALLEALAQRPDAGARLDDFIKVYQVLGIALVRLAGVVQVDSGALEPVVTHPSVRVRRPQAPLPPDEALRRRARGELTRYEAAEHMARHYAALPPEALLTSLHPTWSDGAAGPALAAALARFERPRVLEVARQALHERHGRMVRRTALLVLARMGGIEAKGLLEVVARGDSDAGLRRRAVTLLENLQAERQGPKAVAELARKRGALVAPLAHTALTAVKKDARDGAVEALKDLGLPQVISVLRQVRHADPAPTVRRHATLALAWLGDADLLDAAVRAVEARETDEASAEVAAEVLGLLGDSRGAEVLLWALADGWRATDAEQALRELGLGILEPALRLADERPEVVARKDVRALFDRLPGEPVGAALRARVASSVAHPERMARLEAYLTLATANLHGAAKPVAEALLALPEVAADKKLSRAAKKALGQKA